MRHADDLAVHDLLPDGVVVADENGTILVVNNVARRMLGDVAEPGTHLRDGLTLLDQAGQDWFSVVQPYGGLSTRRGIPEQSWVLPDGTEVLVAARLVRDGRGAPVRRVAVTLRSGRGRTVLDRERSDLVATVAHELRSPLTGVRGFVTTLLSRWDKFNDEQKHLMLQMINSDAERLARLITELLDVARLDTGRMSLLPRETDLTVLVNRAVASVQMGTNRTIEVDVQGTPPPIHADPDRAVQVVTNLIDNAIRHGEGVVRVSIAANGGGTVRFVVDDDGEGISPEIRKRVFTKFWTHGVRGGSGLGMYIVNGLVGAHRGQVTIAESPTGGARIMVDWPTSASVEAEQDRAERETPSRGSITTS